MNDEQKDYDEQTAARIFLRWLGGQQGDEWTFVRAEEKFPELEDHTRWEFVAYQADSDEWIALEHNRLVIEAIEAEFGGWEKVVRQANEVLQSDLQGTYLLDDLPRYNFYQSQRNELVQALTEVVRQQANEVATGERCNIGSEIRNRFPEWPDDTREQPFVDLMNGQLVYPPHPLYIAKARDSGHKLRVAGYWSRVPVWGDHPLARAVQDALKKGKSNPNDQLGLARGKGATRTVLLLDDRIDFDPQVAGRVLGSLDPSHLPNIDEVYLVSTFGGAHVRRVWPKVG